MKDKTTKLNLENLHDGVAFFRALLDQVGIEAKEVTEAEVTFDELVIRADDKEFHLYVDLMDT